MPRRSTPDQCAGTDAALRLPPGDGSRWTRKGWPHGAVARVMAVVEGWVVWRRKGHEPALLHVNQWHDSFEPAVPVTLKKRRAALAATEGP